MSKAYFDFRQFRVYHDRCAMKVGTDSVVLGSAVNIPEECTRILDIGTGCGILALMLAQRSEARITAVELNPDAAEQAGENFSASPWPDRLTVVKEDILDYAVQYPDKFDLIVSNPPYYDPAESFKISEPSRKKARQSGELSAAALASAVDHLLQPGGAFWLIAPVKEGAQLKLEMESRGFSLIKRIYVRSYANSEVIRFVDSYSRIHQPMNSQELVLYTGDRKRSAAYEEITAAYYL